MMRAHRARMRRAVFWHFVQLCMIAVCLGCWWLVYEAGTTAYALMQSSHRTVFVERAP